MILQRLFLLLISFVFLFFSCQKKQDKIDATQVEKPNASVEKSHRVTERVRADFKPELEDWETYRNVDNFVNRFKRVSANEVLSNALELEELVKKMKDTIKPRVLMSSALNARINILYNEALRLSDMTLIPAITSEEVHEQTNKVIKAFSSLNAKINTVLLKKKFEESIGINTDFIGLDTTKMDTFSKKTILRRSQKIPVQE